MEKLETATTETIWTEVDMQKFSDRRAAGRALAKQMQALGPLPGAIVLALPRGGIPVGFEVALSLKAPLDVLVVRKIGLPYHEEFAIGAIASGGMQVLDWRLIHELRIPADEVDRVLARERRELAWRERLYRGAHRYPEFTDSTVIIVDDGLATGSTMRAAVAAVRTHQPARVIVAAPVASREAAAALLTVADHCVFAALPEPFYAVGLWYQDFSETSDDEVLELLARQRMGELSDVPS